MKMWENEYDPARWAQRRANEEANERLTAQQEEESFDRLLAEIAEQTDAIDDADSYDPSDRF